MEQEVKEKHCSKINANYQAYFQLIEHHRLDTILLSKLDDSLFTSRLTNETMPQCCLNLFGDVDGLYQFLSENGEDPEKTSISDIGTINLTECIPNKSKIVKVNCQFQTQKVTEMDELLKFYLRIIKVWESQPQGSQQKFTPAFISKVQPSKGCIERNYFFKKLDMTIDMKNNPFLNSFGKSGSTVKIEDYVHKRIKLFFNQVVPKHQSVYFTLRILKTKSSNFGFGVIDRTEQRADKSHYSICYDFNSGDLKDSNFLRDSAQTRWRKIGPPIASINRAVLKLQINMKDHRIAFYCNDQWVCETVLTDYLFGRQIIPYISVKHQGDQFLLNDE